MLIPCFTPLFGIFFLTTDFTVLANQCNYGFLDDFNKCSYGFEFGMAKYYMEL